jgi:hypothetical protein
MKGFWTSIHFGFVLGFVCGTLISVAAAQAQILCTPIGAGSTLCSGFDANRVDRTITSTALPGGSSIITDYTPRGKALSAPPPVIFAPRAPAARSLERSSIESVMPRSSSIMDWRPPDSGDWHMKDDLPPWPE